MPNPKPTPMMKLADLRDYGVMCFFEYELHREELDEDGNVDDDYRGREGHVKWRDHVISAAAEESTDDLDGFRASKYDQPLFHTYAPGFQSLYNDSEVALRALVESDTRTLIPKLRRRRKSRVDS